MQHAATPRALVRLNELLEFGERSKQAPYTQEQFAHCLSVWLYRGATVEQAARLVQGSWLEGNPLT